MKKILFLLISILAFTQLKAQKLVTADGKEKKEAVASAELRDISDLNVNYSDKSESFALRFGSNTGENGYITAGISMGLGDYSFYNGYLGLGLQKRYFFDDVFLIQAKIWPYLGLSSYSTKTKSYKGGTVSEDKYKFLYGAAAQLELGLNIYTSKGGKEHYVTVGYDINAQEFETDDLIDRGSWQIGLTIIF